MAYITMITNRLLELHRAFKPSGCRSFYCDPTAFHFLKIVLDGFFGNKRYSVAN